MFVIDRFRSCPVDRTRKCSLRVRISVVNFYLHQLLLLRGVLADNLYRFFSFRGGRQVDWAVGSDLYGSALFTQDLLTYQDVILNADASNRDEAFQNFLVYIPAMLWRWQVDIVQPVLIEVSTGVS